MSVTVETCEDTRLEKRLCQPRLVQTGLFMLGSPSYLKNNQAPAPPPQQQYAPQQYVRQEPAPQYVQYVQQPRQAPPPQQQYYVQPPPSRSTYAMKSPCIRSSQGLPPYLPLPFSPPARLPALPPFSSPSVPSCLKIRVSISLHPPFKRSCPSLFSPARAHNLPS